MNKIDIQKNPETREKVAIKLTEIYSNINSWLTFAEAKNASLVALNGAGILGLIGLLTNNDYNGGCLLTIYLWTCTIFLLIGLFISLSSFFPCLNTFNEKKGGCINRLERLNLIFYGDIAKYERSQIYVIDLFKYYYDSIIGEEDINRIELDYADEILINAKIAVRKYKFFKVALIFTLIPIISVSIFLLV